MREDLLKSRYFLKDEDGNPIEDWEGLCRRVAAAIAGDKDEEREFFEVLFDCLFLPNTPTLVNAGKSEMFLSACFVLPVGDSMEEIFWAVSQAALVQKSGGGTGFSFSRLRPSGDMVGSTKGIASGPCSFIRVFDTATDVLKQGGTRRGANMGILRVDHPDIMEFIALKKEEGRLPNFNLSIGITDEFMKALRVDGDFDLRFSGKVRRTLRAREIWDAIIDGAYHNGEPGVVFLDVMNRANPTLHIGEFEATNPCLHGDTLIDTPLGLFKIRELVGREIPVYTWDGEKVGISIAGSFRRTQENAEIWKLTLDDGGEILATPNHKFLLRNGEKRELRDLKPDDSLMPFYRYKANSKGYFRISLNNNETPLEHIFIAEWKYGRKLKDNEEVHHIDGDKTNNNPHNLEILLRKTHARLHKEGRLNPMYKVWDERNIFFRRMIDGKNKREGNGRFREDILTSDIGKLRKEGLSHRRIAKLLGCSERTVGRRLGWQQPVTETLSAVPANHKVVKVEPWGYDDVYNCNVANTHTFAIAYTKKSSGKTGGLIVANCGETPLLPYEACVLGSINLSKMVKNGAIDWEGLEMVTGVAVRFLDNIIDIQHYPLPEIETAHKGNRKIGLGVMGWGDMLIKLGIPYDSEKALFLAERVMESITVSSVKESSKLAELKGVFPNWEGSLWQKNGFRVRNATTTTIAPAGSISIIAGCSSGIEPVFDFVTVQKRPGGEYKVVHPLYEEWVSRNGDKNLPPYFMTAKEVSPECHIKMQAAFQRHTHNAVSKTVNLSHGSSRENVERAFLLAYELGCKGVTVYRDGSRSEQVLTSASSESLRPGHGSKDIIPSVLEAKRVCVETPEGKVYFNISFLDGKPKEIFITTPADSKHQEVYESFARVFSVALRNGVPLSKLTSQLEKANTKYGSVVSVPYALVRAFRYLGVNGGVKCPDCGKELTPEEGCLKCHSCGFTKC